MLLFAWIARPAMMDATFGSFIIPCLGFLFLPFTTLMYVFLMQGVGTIQGLDWLWLILAVVLDLASIGGGRGSQPQSHPCRLSWLVRRAGATATATARPTAETQPARSSAPSRSRTSRRNRSRNSASTAGPVMSNRMNRGTQP